VDEAIKAIYDKFPILGENGIVNSRSLIEFMLKRGCDDLAREASKAWTDYCIALHDADIHVLH